MKMTMGIYHFGIIVSNIDRLLPFYCDILGMKVADDWGVMSSPDVAAVTGIPDAKIRIVMLQMGDQTWELIQMVSPPGKPLPEDTPYAEVGHAHIAFQVDNVEDTCEYLKEKGIRIVCAPQEIGGKKFFYCRDPEGLWVEFIEEISGS
jgi:catechol 2,3-dioxygenase-like lactoylglutathione lyase family enzyme